MMNRALALLLLMVVVTALIKKSLIRNTGGQHTPSQASQALRALQDPSNTDILLDGFGRPFYPDPVHHVLRSAGHDGRFHTGDDTLFLLWSEECPGTLKTWARDALSQEGWDFSNLPEGWELNSADFSLRGGPLECPLPRLAGPDGVFDSADDWLPLLQKSPMD